MTALHPFIPSTWEAFGRQRQPSLQSEFQDSYRKTKTKTNQYRMHPSPPNSGCLSQYSLPPSFTHLSDPSCSYPRLHPVPPAKSILLPLSREIHISLSNPCYLASLGLWIVAWLSFTFPVTHLQVGTNHVCLSDSGLPHSGCSFLLPSICWQIL